VTAADRDWILRVLIVRTRSAVLRRLRAEPQPDTTQEELQWLTEHFS
jgi:hypothetical protein